MKFLITQSRPWRDGKEKFFDVALCAEASDALHAAAAIVRLFPGRSTQVWRRHRRGLAYSLFSTSRADDVERELRDGLSKYREEEKKWNRERKQGKAAAKARLAFANRYEHKAFMEAREDEAFRKLYWSDDDPTFEAAAAWLTERGIHPLQEAAAA